MAAPSAIAATVGKAFTVKLAVAELVQLFPSVYVYVTVTVPAVKPVTTPPAVILAVPVPATIDHVPPAVAFVKAGVCELTQTVAAPSAIAATAGKAFSVIITEVDAGIVV